MFAISPLAAVASTTSAGVIACLQQQESGDGNDDESEHRRTAEAVTSSSEFSTHCGPIGRDGSSAFLKARGCACRPWSYPFHHFVGEREEPP
jgi:hypothetical protein